MFDQIYARANLYSPEGVPLYGYNDAGVARSYTPFDKLTDANGNPLSVGMGAGQWTTNEDYADPGLLPADFLKSIGYNGTQNGDADENGQGGDHAWDKFLASNNIQIGRSAQADGNIHYGAFQNGQRIGGNDYTLSQNDGGDAFGLAILAAAGGVGLLAAGAGAAGAAAGGLSAADGAGGLALAEGAYPAAFGAIPEAGAAAGGAAGLGAVDGAGGVGLAEGAYPAAFSGLPEAGGVEAGLGAGSSAYGGAGGVSNFGLAEGAYPAGLGSVPAGVGAGGAASGLSSAASGLIPGISNSSLLGAGASLASGLYGSAAAKSAADAQLKSVADANALAKYMYDTTRADNLPALQSRNNALAGLNGLMANSGSVVNDPGYQFQQQQGQMGLDRKQAAGGGLYSGAALKAASRFNTDYATTKLNDSYNRLGTIAGLGSVGASTIANAGANYANNASQNIIGGGNAAAAGTIGSANAIGGALTSAYNNYQQNSLLDALLRKGG